MAPRAEQVAHAGERLKELLGRGCGSEALHHAFADACGLVGLLDAVVAPTDGADLHVLDPSHLGRLRERYGVAAQRVGRDALGRRAASAGQQASGEPFGRRAEATPGSPT